MKKIILCFLFLSCPFLADAADWPMFRGDMLNSGRTPEVVQAPLVLKWSFQAGDKIVSTATIKDGKVYIGSRDDKLYALDEETGAKIWEFETGHWVDSSATVTDEKVFFASRDGYFYALNNTDGSKLWRHETAGTDTSSPKVENNIVYTGAGFPNKYIYAMSALTGDEIWRHETGQMVYSSGALTDDHLWIGSNDGKVYKLKKSSGEKMFQYATEGSVYYAAPAMEGSVLYLAAGNNDWKVHALNLNSNKPLWVYEFPNAPFTPNYVSSVAIGPDHIYVVMGYYTQEILALDKNTGALAWKADLGKSTRYGFSSSPAVTAHTVYAATSEGILKAFNRADGTLVWEYDLGSEVLSSISVANGTLYVGTLEGKLLAFK